MTRLTSKLRPIVVAAVVLLLASGCSTDGPSGTQPSSVQEQAAPVESATEDVAPTEDVPEDAGQDEAPPQDEAGATEVSIPAGAVAATTDFPFPVPEGWSALEEFEAGQIGKSEAMYAGYEYPGAAADAAQTYQDLLVAAGYIIHPDLLGATLHEAAFIVEGPVNGTLYKGSITFNTHADGYQRAAINLTVED